MSYTSMLLSMLVASAAADAANAAASDAADAAHKKAKATFFTPFGITILVIAALQVVFCVLICLYTQKKVKAAKEKKHQQEAEFYEFLYQFHKQMADEEHAMQQLNKP